MWLMVTGFVNGGNLGDGNNGEYDLYWLCREWDLVSECGAWRYSCLLKNS